MNGVLAWDEQKQGLEAGVAAFERHKALSQALNGVLPTRGPTT